MFRKILLRLAKTKFVRESLADTGNLDILLQRPTIRVYIGIFFILFSYVIGWPAVALLGVIAVYMKEPLIGIVGGPITYGLSHLVFLYGAYLAGITYVIAILRWATRKAYEKFCKP